MRIITVVACALYLTQSRPSFCVEIHILILGPNINIFFKCKIQKVNQIALF